jgi:hypothetical protein
MTTLDKIPNECMDIVASFMCQGEKKDVLNDAMSIACSAKCHRYFAEKMKQTLWKELYPSLKYPEKECENIALNLMKECVEKPWIELNRVSKYYILKPSDRVGIRTTIQFEYGTRWGTRYWWTNAVQIACMNKFTTIEYWCVERERLDKDREKRYGKKRLREDERRRELEICLKQRGCDLRSDSVLCREYIESGRGDCHEIAVIMEQMKFFHTHTDYANIYREMARKQRDMLGCFDSDDVSGCAKTLALEKWKKKFGASCVARVRPELPTSLRHLV